MGKSLPRILLVSLSEEDAVCRNVTAVGKVQNVTDFDVLNCVMTEDETLCVGHFVKDLARGCVELLVVLPSRVLLVGLLDYAEQDHK